MRAIRELIAEAKREGVAVSELWMLPGLVLMFCLGGLILGMMP